MFQNNRKLSSLAHFVKFDRLKKYFCTTKIDKISIYDVAKFKKIFIPMLFDCPGFGKLIKRNQSAFYGTTKIAFI